LPAHLHAWTMSDESRIAFSCGNNQKSRNGIHAVAQAFSPLKYPIHGGRHTVRQRCFYTRVDVDKVDWAWTCRGDDAKIVALRKQGIERTESICPWGFEVTVPVGTSRNLSGFASYRALSVDSVLATLRAYFSAIFLIVLPPRIVNGTQRVFSMGTLEKPTPLRFLRRNQ